MSIAKKLPVQHSAPAKWDCKKYGSLSDPFHKSHASSLVGEYSCLEQFRRDRLREVAGEQRTTCSGKTEMGTAGHETIARAIRNESIRMQLLTGDMTFSASSIRRVLLDEFQNATSGKDVVWYGKADYEDTVNDVVAMLDGLFRDFHRHVAAIELVEAGWIAQVGKHWCEGHIDLVYRPQSCPTKLGLTDWKTGTMKPHQIELDHGFESGLYSAALQRGIFLPVELLRAWREQAKADPAKVPLGLWDAEAIHRVGTEREAMHVALRGLARMAEDGKDMPEGVVRFGEFPEVIRLTHLADYVPYDRAGAKAVERPEEVEHWSRVLGRPVDKGEKVKYVKGQTRGPAWYCVRRTETDIQRLEKRLSAIVGWVRMGLFVDAVGEKCVRCSYREDCLAGGYELKGDAAKELNAALKGLDFEGLPGLDD